MIHFDMSGLIKQMEDVEELSKATLEASKTQFTKNVSETLKKSVSVYTPIDTGNLRSSAIMEFKSNSFFTFGNNFRIDLIFRAKYASTVHENPLGYNFKVGKEKFLTTAIKKANDFIDTKSSYYTKKVNQYLKNYTSKPVNERKNIQNKTNNGISSKYNNLFNTN